MPRLLHARAGMKLYVSILTLRHNHHFVTKQSLSIVYSASAQSAMPQSVDPYDGTSCMVVVEMLQLPWRGLIVEVWYDRSRVWIMVLDKLCILSLGFVS